MVPEASLSLNPPRTFLPYLFKQLSSIRHYHKIKNLVEFREMGFAVAPLSI